MAEMTNRWRSLYHILYVFFLFAPLLVIVSDGSAGTSACDVTSLIGVEWKWQGSRYNNDTKNVPAEPDRYILTLQPDGRVNIRADCNRGGGTYTLDENKISITINHTTRAACPPESLEQPFIRDLNGVAGWLFMDGDLYMDIKYDTGTMRFSK